MGMEAETDLFYRLNPIDDVLYDAMYFHIEAREASSGLQNQKLSCAIHKWLW